MSRQMAFQLTEFEYKKTLGRIVAAYDDRSAKDTIDDWVTRMEPDEKKRDRIKAVLVISVRCHSAGVDPLAVRKLICWRDDQGKPAAIEAEVDGRRLKGDL